MHTPALVVPPLTPFTSDLEVDLQALQRGVEYVVTECRATMVVAAGVEAQEYQYLSAEQRLDLIDRTIEFVDGRRPVVVGVSHPSFKQTIELAQHAESRGAHGIQLLAPLRPFGGQPTTRDLVAYFEAVTAETSLPVMLYLNPASGAELSIPTTVELSRLDGVAYVKESSRDLARVSRLIVEIEDPGHAHYFTTMQMLLISLQLGGSGVTLPPPAAKLANMVVTAFAEGKLDEAARLQRQFALFPSRWMHHGLPTVMKAAAQLLGVPAGEPYPPYRPIGGDELGELRAYLSTTDLALDLVPEKET
ncbi:MAG: dihydrodipicolinate synthase family protein [Nocardioidaceae bacterium]